MGVLSDLEPKRVFHFFEEITRIPHGSGNVEEISDYLVRFARERGLKHIQDELKNVILVKEATPGYEKDPAVILQGHMDMVAVKKPDCDIDMAKEGLRVAVRGDEVYAEGTSLGGDDGIAVAYALALLDSDTIQHPKLEVILTVDEEVGMDGARGIDLSMLTGNRMINLDSEEEGIFLTSCAGGARVHCNLPLKMADCEGIAMKVTVGGLQGGHSGGEIHKERGNANCLFGRLLQRLTAQIPVCIREIAGGLADNAIPRETAAVLVIEERNREKFMEILRMVETEIRAELATKDPGFVIETVEAGQGHFFCVTAEDTGKAAAFLCALPNGVQAMSADMPGLVETSLNLGILKVKMCNRSANTNCQETESGIPKEASRVEAGNGIPEEADCEKAGNGVPEKADCEKAVNDVSEESCGLLAEFSVRSSVESAKRALIDRLCAVTKLAGGSNTVTGDYPGWKYRKDSPLRDKMVVLYREMYGAEPKVEAIHAGLECGILGSKIQDLDCVSIGPDMTAIHTTEETLSISSTGRVWEYLVRLLELH